MKKKKLLQPIQMNLIIDGKTLAQEVKEILEQLYESKSDKSKS